MRHINVVMVTIDRSPGKNYLCQTMSRIRESGVMTSKYLDSFFIFDSVNSDWIVDEIGSIDTDRIVLWDSKGRVTANENVAMALGTINRPSGWTLFLEDDIDVCDLFLESVADWLEECATDNISIYPLGSTQGGVLKCLAHKKHSFKYPIGEFYGTQAFAIRGKDAIELAEYIADHIDDRSDDGTAYDLLMTDWMKSKGVTHVMTPCPSFVQHIGLTSVIRPREDVHTFPSWPGREWTYEVSA